MTLLTPTELSFFHQWLTGFDVKFFLIAVPLGVLAAFAFGRGDW